MVTVLSNTVPLIWLNLLSQRGGFHKGRSVVNFNARVPQSFLLVNYWECIGFYFLYKIKALVYLPNTIVVSRVLQDTEK